MAKNSFQKLAEFYKECVDKEDEKGFAETYEKATDLLFKRIKNELNLDLHFTDIEYFDGYFIFGHGTNSVVHFHIKEAPGWLGGIWWFPANISDNEDYPEYATDYLNCYLFFQYEEEIDKFKPSASMFGGNKFGFYFEDGHGDRNFYDSCCDLGFIIKEPYLAFYKEMHYTDFNHEYVDKRKAKRYFIRHFEQKKIAKQIRQDNDKELLELMKYILGPILKDDCCFIFETEYMSPKYRIRMKDPNPNDIENSWANQRGWLFDLGYEDEKEDKKLYDKKIKELTKKAKKNKTNWYSPISLCVDFVSENTYTEIKKNLKEENRLTLSNENVK